MISELESSVTSKGSEVDKKVLCNGILRVIECKQ